jgi:hypothetical protein
MAMYEWATEHLDDLEGARKLHEGAPEPPRLLAAA